VTITLTWEAVGVLIMGFGVVQAVSIAVVRAVVREEMRRVSQPIEVCKAVHAEVERRLERLEEKG
jgi:hypothetical protein